VIPSKVTYCYWVSLCLTFVVLVVSWIPFRANTFQGWISMYKSMFGFYGISLPQGLASVRLLQNSIFVFDGLFPHAFVTFKIGLIYIVISCFACWFLPNSTQVVGYVFQRDHTPERRQATFKNITWGWTKGYSYALAGMFLVALLLQQTTSEFFYFNF